MKTAGIICECNPLHGGHLHLLEAARTSGVDCVVALMSGCFVQRGDAAVADPYARAEILVRSGFDAVLELPFPFSAAGAEFFGGAGVEILSRLGVNELWFGSESGELAVLERAAELADSPVFAERYAMYTQGPSGTAEAYFHVLEEMLASRGLHFDPNDILALSYLRAIRKCGGGMVPRTVKRTGSGYRETALSKSVFPSATALRRVWKEEGFAAIRESLPDCCAAVLERETEAGRAPAAQEHAERAILSHLRLTPLEVLEGCAELGGGVGARLKGAALQSASLGELLALAATKKYTDARLRRGALFAVTGVKPEDLRRHPAYVRLLGANAVGCAFLAGVRRSASIPVVTRQSDIPMGEAADAQFDLECRARAFFTLSQPTAADAVGALCRAPFIWKGEK